MWFEPLLDPSRTKLEPSASTATVIEKRHASPIRAILVFVALSLAMTGCKKDEDDPLDMGAGGTDAGSDSSTGGTGGTFEGGVDAKDDVEQDASADTSHDTEPDAWIEDEDVLCPVTFQYSPSGSPSQILVAGEWHGFDLSTATVMNATGGGYQATVNLSPGLHAYKIVVDDDWRLDPNQGRRKYVGTPPVENSAIKVEDCRLPSLSVVSSTVARPSLGAGTYQAELNFTDGVEASGPDVAGYSFELQRNGESLPVSGGVAVGATGGVTVSLSNLQDGKYRLVGTPRSTNGRVGNPLRLIFWVEEEPFSWKDAIVYMVLIDRFRDGDSTNNAPPTPGADPRGDWQGGDLQGVRDAIADGTLEALGVRAIWFTPFQTNPAGSYLAHDEVHRVTGYHGYWPIKAREVDPRIGGEAALREMVNEAHAKGIRILQDYVINHVHEDHEYMTSHPEWFRTGCVCGTENCDWTAHALDCMFAPYMPDINHTVPEANAAFVEDAIWWMDEFDIDGLRVDAVKHVEEVIIRNLTAEVRETFEPAGVRHFLMGETAMGWSDCDDPCNEENYGTISNYMGPYGLDGQFDFVLYHGVSYNTFATESRGMIHADYWFQNSMKNYPSDSVMTPYIGSHDTARFVTLADPANASKAHHQWTDIAGDPNSDLPYERARVGFAWLLNLPGAPLLYYGDEYGQWGGADPNNRLMWKDPSSLNAQETETLLFLRKLGTARKEVRALRHGDYISLDATEDTLVFGRRIAAGNAAIVALTRASTTQTHAVEVANSLGFAAGTVLQDRLGGPSVTVGATGQATLSIPAKSAVVLAP